MQGALWGSPENSPYGSTDAQRVLWEDLPYLTCCMGTAKLQHEADYGGLGTPSAGVYVSCIFLIMAPTRSHPFHLFDFQLPHRSQHGHGRDRSSLTIRLHYGDQSRYSRFTRKPNADNLALQNIQVCQFSFATHMFRPDEKVRNNYSRRSCV